MVNGFEFPVRPVIRKHDILDMKWGLVPHWSKDPGMAKYNLNARSETVFDKPSFREAIVKRRCLVPANGYVEWQHIGKEKKPWIISLKNSDDFCFAGIWESWINPMDRSVLESYTILTTAANPLMARIHNTKQRMPVILPTEEMEQEWLFVNQSVSRLNDLMVAIDERLIDVKELIGGLSVLKL
jgi:putative SOS response-associated peptidase YedK